ncbi:hypothetical protein ACFLW6_00365 [Chloroflexota bacterium]
MLAALPEREDRPTAIIHWNGALGQSLVSLDNANWWRYNITGVKEV